MINLMAFLSSFASYLMVFLIFIAAIAVAVIIGVSARKIINKKKDVKDNAETQNN